MLKYNHNLKQKARHLRAEMTGSEQTLWSRLRRKQIWGVQFYRQKPIGNYIVDFYAPQAKLAIEIDGSQHMDPHQAQKDVERDAYLASEGLRVLRFNNLQVLQELDSVVEVIFQELTDRLDGNPPLAPLCKGGLGGFPPPDLAS